MKSSKFVDRNERIISNMPKSINADMGKGKGRIEP
jgi:hypothetical protein